MPGIIHTFTPVELPVVSRRDRRFTLVELLVAMGLLIVIMMMLFEFFSGAQAAWHLTAANTRIYENARVALELVERDLRGALTSATTGEEIPFYIHDHFSPGFADDEILTFVAAAGLTQNARSRLCEVTYSHTSTGSDAYTLRRRLVADRTIADVENANWDFYGNPGGGWEATADAADAFQEVIGGVEEVQVVCFDTDGTAIASSELTSLPAYVQISITLFDESLASLATELGATAWQARIDKTKRTFSKIVFLSQ